MIAAIYGDSISTTEYGNGGYQEMLRECAGLEKIYNHSISATCLAAIRADSGIEVLKKRENKHSDADIVILWYGTNDWYYGSPIGTLDDTDQATFCGALNSAVALLKEMNPNVKIILPTPMLRKQAPEGVETEGDALTIKNRIGETQGAYTDAIFKIGQREGITVIDMRKETGFSLSELEMYLPDGVHPSEKGYRVITQIFKSALE